MRERIGLVLGPGLFLFVLAFVQPEGMEPVARHTLAITLWMAVWWVSEAVPIPFTSLLPIVLFPLMGVMNIQDTLGPYSHKIIYLFLGGFILALAMEKWNLHRRIALAIILAVGSDGQRLVLGFMLATGLLSMWISNTATTLMMVPIALAITFQFQQMGGKRTQHLSTAMLLAIAYSASIGGMATIIGTPTNAIFVGYVESTYGQSVSFGQWMFYGLPISLVLLAATWWHLTFHAFPLKNVLIPGGREELLKQKTALGPISWEEKAVLLIFGLVALAWIVRAPVKAYFIPGLDDTIIALVGAGLLFIIPSKNRPERLMDWATAVKLPWGILLLFGGAFSLAKGVDVSGLGLWLAELLEGLNGVSILLILGVIITGVNFVTEITQNMGTCTLMMPVLAALAPALDTHPFGLMAGTCVAASCAFMLPFATAPNAIVFGAGNISMQDMIRAGFRLNLISIVVITLFTYFLLPSLWNISWDIFPADLAKG
ncbi:MAG: SLC13 family permease [Bacteroidota bacterium]